MIAFLIIFLIGFLWLTRDIIRVPENFDDSYFKRFTGNKFIDPQASWANQYVGGYLLSFFIASFSDLFHLLGTLILSAFFILVYFMPELPIDFIAFFIISFLSFGTGAFTAQYMWREWLKT